MRSELLERETKSVDILVVDDEVDICWAIENVLRLAEFVVESTFSGGEAIAFLAKENCKLAFVDVRLPDIDGFSLADLIRQKSPYTYIILMSGYYYPEDRVIVKSTEDKRIDGFLGKPFDLNEVLELAHFLVGSVE